MRCDSARHGERLYNFSSSASAFGSVTGATRCGNVYGPLNTRKDTKIFNATSAVRTAKSAFSKIKVDALTVSGQEALVFQPRVMAEVHEQTQLAIRCAEIIQDLRTVLVSQLRDRFDFKKYFFVANEIRTQCLYQCTGRDIATFAVASTKMEFVGIPARSRGTHDKPARETRSPYLGKR